MGPITDFRTALGNQLKECRNFSVWVQHDKEPAPRIGKLQFTRHAYIKWVLSGSMELAPNGKGKVVLGPGDGVLFGPDSYVNLYYPNDVRFLRVTFGEEHTHVAVQALSPKIVGDSYRLGFPDLQVSQISGRQPPEALSLLAKLLSNRDETFPSVDVARFVLLAEALYRWISPVSPEAGGIVGKIEGLIEGAYSRAISLEAAAAMLGLSGRHINRTLRAASRPTFNQLLNERRLRAAEDLLSGTHIPLEEVSQACGFSSGSYFSQAFRRAHGMSPSDWRKMHRR